MTNFNELRKRKEARPEFKLSRQELLSYVGETITIKYDEKSFTGKVDDIYLDGLNNSGFIITDGNEWKHIKVYRIEEILKIRGM